jgi:hypothetical protein
MKIIHDKVNARVITEDDSFALFYTDSLSDECFKKNVVDTVVDIYNNSNVKSDLFGSDGSLDSYLLDCPYCTQEDREEIIESIYRFANNLGLL